MKLEESHEILSVIIEDNPLNSTLLKDLLNDHFPFIRIAGIAATIREAKPLFRHHDIDLLFLDIELPDGKGFDLLASLPSVNFEVIVTTSFSGYAIQAIQNSALDYILKPVCLEDLSKAIDRFVKKFNQGKRVQKSAGSNWSLFHRLPLPTADGLVFVNTDDIIHAEADGSYTTFRLLQGRKIMVSKPLCDFEERLIPRNFFRIHHSHIINLAQILKYVRGEGGHVVMSDNALIPVARSKKDEFLRIVGL